MSQFDVVNKEFYAIYERDSGKPLVRRIKAEDHDNAWDVAEALGQNLVDVVDIPQQAMSSLQRTTLPLKRGKWIGRT